MPSVEQVRAEIRRKLISCYGEDPSSVDAFFDLWGELVNTLIMCGLTATEIINDVENIECVLDRDPDFMIRMMEQD